MTFLFAWKMGILGVFQSTALRKETSSELRILKIALAMQWHFTPRNPSLPPTNGPCGSNTERRLYITSSPYRGKDKCYGKALFLLIIPGIPCLQYLTEEVLCCL